MNNIKNSKLLLFSIFIISIAIVIFFKYLTQNSCFWGDDYFFSRYREYENLFDCLNFRSGHGSGYIGFFLCKFFSFKLPVLINIHPNDFLCNGANIIRGIFSCFVLLSIISFAVFKNKSKLILVFMYLFTACYFFSNGMKSCVILVNYNYYRYFFSLLFYCVFWLYIYKNIISDEKFIINKKAILTLLLMGFCGFAIGTSIEINFFVSLMLAGLIVIYTILFRKNKYKLNISFYFPVSILCLAVFLFTSSLGFQSVAADRGMTDINVTYDIFKEFSALYYRVCFKEEILYWILFICLAVTAFVIAKKNNEIKQVVFPLLMEISVLTIIYSLIMCGKTYPFNNQFILYLYHSNIVCLYKMLILVPLYIYFDYVINNIKTRKTLLIVTVLLIAGSCIYGTDCRNNSQEFINRLSEMKKDQYMYQKIMRYYNIQKQKAKIPQMFLRSFNELNQSFLHISTEVQSMDSINKDNLARRYGYEIVPDGIELFYKDGGAFSDEELKDIKFSRLKYNNFVLNIKTAY